MDGEQIQAIAQALLRHNIDGVIATNTTINRDAVQNMKHAEETGGLSGAPVFESSNVVIRALKKELGNALPIIGVGGILSGIGCKGQDRCRRFTGAVVYRLDLSGSCAGSRMRRRTARPICRAKIMMA